MCWWQAGVAWLRGTSSLSSATQLFETLTRLIEAKTLAQQKSGEEAAAQAWRPQDEIIVTSVDHEANRGAWLRLAERLNLSVKTWQPSRLPHATHPTHVTLSLDGLRALVTPRTRLVAFTAASNVLGSHFTDVELQQIVQTVRESSEGKAYVAVDAVAFAPHMRLRPEVWGVDFVVWSWYKVRCSGLVILCLAIWTHTGFPSSGRSLELTSAACICRRAQELREASLAS